MRLKTPFSPLAACVAVLALVASAPAAELNLFCWSQYVPKEIVDGFTRETGIKVNEENYDSN
jgi:spermidine/putrescine-binding protein